MDLGENFDGLCGIPDWYKGDGDECIIVDLKTAADATPNKYYWHCLSFGYFRQQAMYQFILNKTKGYTKFTSKHLVIEKDIDCIHNSYAFILDQNQIESEKKKLELIFEDIKNEKDFAPRNATWDEALIIGGNEII